MKLHFITLYQMGGDGSAYPQWFNTMKLAEWHQENLVDLYRKQNSWGMETILSQTANDYGLEIWQIERIWDESNHDYERLYLNLEKYYGKLSEYEVQPIVKHLPDNVYIWRYVADDYCEGNSVWSDYPDPVDIGEFI